jgi:S1-C subfamily serine protease
VTLVLAVGLGEAVGSGLGRWISYRLGRGFLSATDRVAGGAIGVGQAVLVVWLAGGLLAAGPVPRLAQMAQNSAAVRSLSAVLPPPTEIAADLGDVLDESGLPDVFVGLEPLPAAPVELPSDPQARAIGERAAASTVKVTSAACDAQLTGTGFAIAPDYVLTNAHVVAGATRTRVTLGSDTHDATPVLFDPELDVAVLWVRGLRASALRFAAADPPRGAEGAALGYPNGRGLAVVAAAVAGHYPATGRDIYADRKVTRQILELRADIERGDSGGPFVLADGTVGGVVFAEARTDPEVGYALSPTEVSVRVAPATGRTGGVDTGPCID